MRDFNQRSRKLHTPVTPKKIATCLILFLFFVAPLRQGFSRPDMEFFEGAQKRVSIDLRDSDIIDVLKFLSQKGKFNIFINPGIQGRVTLYLENVKIADILDIILLSNGLAHEEKDSIVYIMTQEEYKIRFGQDYNDARQVNLVKLKYAPPNQVFKMLEPIKSKVGSIVVDEQSGTIILVDIPEKAKFMLDVIKEVDKPLETKIFDLDFSKAADLVTVLKTKVDTQNIGAIQADVRSNQIVVTTLPNKMQEIASLIEKLDRQTREVVIDAQIVKIDLSNDYRQGINWEYLFRRGLMEPLDLTLAVPNTNLGVTPLPDGQTIQYGSLSNEGYTATFQFLNSLGDTRILASPRITVIEGEEAKILIGSREVSLTSTTTVGTGGAGNTVSDSVSFVDVGTSLTVSALINKRGYVTLKVKPEVSSVRERVTSSSSTSNTSIPVVDTTQAETRMMIKDGATVVMGGLRKQEKHDTSHQVPFVSKLPLVGNLFKHRNKELDQSELVVFLTPHIIDGSVDVIDDGHGLSPKDIQSYFNEEVKPIDKETSAKAASLVAPENPLAPKDVDVYVTKTNKFSTKS